jgi:hypothetical protein
MSGHIVNMSVTFRRLTVMPNPSGCGVGPMSDATTASVRYLHFGRAPISTIKQATGLGQSMWSIATNYCRSPLTPLKVPYRHTLTRPAIRHSKAPHSTSRGARSKHSSLTADAMKHTNESHYCHHVNHGQRYGLSYKLHWATASAAVPQGAVVS